MANSADSDQFRSQLIWIYTVCKGRTYQCSVRQGLRFLFFHFIYEKVCFSYSLWLIWLSFWCALYLLVSSGLLKCCFLQTHRSCLEYILLSFCHQPRDAFCISFKLLSRCFVFFFLSAQGCSVVMHGLTYCAFLRADQTCLLHQL